MKNSRRKFAITLGITLTLLTVVLALNVGLVARGINFPLIYTFGAAVYAVYGVLLLLAALLISGKRLPKLKHPYYVLPIIFLLVGFSFLSTIIVNWKNDLGNTDLFEVYNNAFKNAGGGYWTATFINLFTSKLAGGILSFIPVKFMIDFMGQGGTLAIIIIVIVIGFALAILPWLITYIKKWKAQHNENKVIKQEKKKEVPTREITFSESNVYEHADEVGENEVTPVVQNVETIVPSFASRGEDNVAPNLFTKEVSEPGAIVKPKFTMSGARQDEISGVRAPEVNTPVAPVQSQSEEEDIVPSFMKNNEEEKPVIETREEHIEQMNLDFDAKPEFNEELISAQPEFVAPKEVEKPVIDVVPPVTFEPEPEPEQEPVKKEREPFIWLPPSTDSLATYEISEDLQLNESVANERKDLINIIFQDFKIAASCSGFTIGPSITRFHIDYESNGLVKSVNNITEDISRRLSGVPVRFEATVPGYSYSGLEVPNAKVTTVSFKEVFEALPDVNKHPTAVPFGKDITGKVIVADYAEFPHLLVSGTTGSGKSVFVNSIITTLIMRLSPDDFKLVLVDPKTVEMSKYEGIPHLICPIINEASQAKVMLDKLVVEMNNRYKEFNGADYASDINEYNEYAVAHGIRKKPRILIVLDEYADLVDNCKEIGAPVQSIAQKARAAGIHLLIATQRPTTNIITGTIKANLSTRVSLSAASTIDSITILDEGGAEKLLGRGDMLVKSPLLSRAALSRLQGCYVKGKEILTVINYLKNQYPTDYWEDYLDLEDHSNDVTEAIGSGHVNLNDEMSEDDKYEAIKEWCSCEEYVSMSKIQRNFSVGFNKAGKLFNKLIADGIVEASSDNPSRGNRVLNRESRFLDSDIVTSNELVKKDQ